MFVELSVRHFLGCLHDQRRAFCVEQSEIVIGLRGRPLNQPQRANEWARKSIAAYEKIQHRAVRRRTMKRVRRQGHLTHRIFFCSLRLSRHAERSAPTPTNPENFSGCMATRCPRPCSEGVLWKTVMNIGGMFCRKYSDSVRSKSVACCFNSFVT